MNVSPNELRKELAKLMAKINAQIAEVEKLAETRGVAPEQIIDANGGYAMTPLLLAKAQCYSALIMLQDKK